VNAARERALQHSRVALSRVRCVAVGVVSGR
jgi:hypothetical protein